MNIYDTKIVSCLKCGKCIGEINVDASITSPKCGRCEQMDLRKRQDINSPNLTSPLFAVPA